MSTLANVTDIAIQMNDVAKSYRSGFLMRQTDVVREVSMTVPAGSLFGYLGHNGAGKTTTIKMLLGLVAPTSGSVALFGGSPGDLEIRRRVGYLPEHPYFYDYLTASEFLAFHGQLCGLDPKETAGRAAELMNWVGLEGTEDVRLQTFSKGMLQRIGLAQALIGDPDLVVLDEPMSGLDPAGRKLVRDIMLELKRRGKTVFFSTHVLSDAEAICDQVAILVQGSIRSIGPLSELLTPEVTEVELIISGLPQEFVLPGTHTEERDGLVHVRVTEESCDTDIQAVLAAGGKVVSVTPHRQSLEHLFMSELDAVERAG